MSVKFSTYVEWQHHCPYSDLLFFDTTKGVSIMLCPTCGGEMQKITGRYQYRECGLDNVYFVGHIFVCERCDLKLPLLRNPEESAKLITQELVRQPGRLDGDSILFLRKAMGLKSAELARVLGVDRATVSRWENNNTQIEGLKDLKLRLEAVDRLCPPSKRPELKEEVVAVFQHEYTPSIAICQSEIAVPYSGGVSNHAVFV